MSKFESIQYNTSPPMVPKKFSGLFESKTKLNDHVWQINFSIFGGVRIDFVAGQYLIVDCEGKGKRMYSIATSPKEKSNFSFIINYYPGGLASEYFMRMKMGDEVNFVGPIGKFILRPSPAEKVFLVTGTGIAPARSMILNSIENNSSEKLNLFWGMRNIEDLYLQEELETLEGRSDNFKYTLCFSRENDGGVDTKHKNTHHFFGRYSTALMELEEKTRLFTTAEFYLCGGGKVVEDTKRFLLEQGVGRERIFYERFD